MTVPSPRSRRQTSILALEAGGGWQPQWVARGEHFSQPWYRTGNDLPANWTQAANNTGDATQGGIPLTVMFWDLPGIPVTDPIWDTFLNQLTLREMQAIFHRTTHAQVIAANALPVGTGTMGAAGIALADVTHTLPAWMGGETVTIHQGVFANAFGITAIPRVGKPRSHMMDGPAAFRSVGGNPDNSFDHVYGGWVDGHGTIFGAPQNQSTTWNTNILRLVGRQKGNEGIHFNQEGHFNLTLDLRRHQYSGRAWENCSEEAFIVAMRGQWHSYGAHQMGHSPKIKHFAVYSQKAGNGGNNAAIKFMTEQTLREVHLRAFEYAIKFGYARSIMTAYSRIGIMCTASSYNFLYALTKGEWGFKGHISNDMAGNSNTSSHNRNRMNRLGISEMSGFSAPGASPEVWNSGDNWQGVHYRWNADLRGGLGGVETVGVNGGHGRVSTLAGTIPTGGEVATHTESAATWYGIRMHAKRAIYVMANSSLLSARGWFSYVARDGSTAWRGRNIGQVTQGMGRSATLVNNPGPTQHPTALTPFGTPGAGFNVALTSAEQAMVRQGHTNAAGRYREGADIVYRLHHRSSLPAGMVLNEETGGLDVRTMVTGGRYTTPTDTAGGVNTGGSQGHSSQSNDIVRESWSRPFEFDVELLLDGRVQRVERFSFTTVSAFDFVTGAGEDAVRQNLGNNIVTLGTQGQALPNTAMLQGDPASPLHLIAGPVTATVGAVTQRSRVEMLYEVVGHLPAGLTLLPDGRIIGTPVVAGQFDVSIRTTRDLYSMPQFSGFGGDNANRHDERENATMRTQRRVFYSHATFIVEPAGVNVGDALTAEQVQAMIDGRLTAEQAAQIIANAITNNLTQAEIQALIDAAIAAIPVNEGCGGFALADSVVLFVILAIALTGILLVVTLRKKKAKTE